MEFHVDHFCEDQKFCRVLNFTLHQDELLTASKKYTVTSELEFFNCQMEKIPRNLLEIFSNVNCIKIWKCKLESIDSTSLDSSKLKDIKVKHNNINIVKEYSFKNCKNLQNLDMRWNKIKEIEPNTLRILKNIKSIFLSYNELKTIDGLFQYLESPDLIDIRNNKIKVIKKDHFQKCINLKRVILSDNEILEIESGSFDHLRYLEYLHLKGNRLRKLDTIHVVQAYFENNYLTSYKISNATRLIKLDNNILQKIECANSGKMNIKSFVATNNLLDDWTCIREMHDLELLNLSHNKFREFNCKTFSSLKKLSYLHLDHNQFKNLEIDDLYSLNKLASLSVDNFTDYYNINEVLPKLGNLGLTINNWECSYIDKVFCVLKLQKILPRINDFRYINNNSEFVCKTPLTLGKNPIVFNI
jgi:Leucine-rich repeat (LRR) protein